ncbi:carboxymuconolactone decarboxylase family protein [Ruminococcaceae bacterium OttesenSCG-928-I18]|nr:carboxymuconolactone decarboxylase family protein [Ruminococcaceae bacterium OttesenSCG-928-I18]
MAEQMGSTTERVERLNESLKGYWDASPEVIGAFKQLRKAACNEEGALDFKTKECIAIAVSIARKCEPCILSHLEVGIKAGVTREELVEAGNIAVLLCGGPGYAYATFALEAYDDLVAGK